MSSTNPNTRGGGEHDFFRTPEWVTRAILPHLNQRLLRRGHILEPSAGDGAIIDVLRGYGATGRISAVEVRQDGCDKLRLGHDGAQCIKPYDFLDIVVQAERYGDPRELGYEVDLVIGNPPFKHALEHLQHAISLCAPGGQVAFLLRLGFLASKKRAAFHRAHPANVYVLPKRPSFTGKGTDSAEYMWWVHTKGQTRPGTWRVLEVSP